MPMPSIDLSPRAKFKLNGSDRVRYLNGQVSNDVTKLDGTNVLSACVTTVKGRLEGHVFITSDAGGEALLIDAEPELREPLFARLSKYIIADDAELEDVTDQFVLVHDLGEGGEGYACTRLAEPGRDRWCAKGDLAAGSDWLSAAAAERLRVERGVPKWGAELTPETLPAEALLDRSSIDFHKGCYVGQEVISRIESVGRVNRTLVALRFDGGSPQPGWHLADPEGKRCGTVTSIASMADGAVLGLGYLKRGASIARAEEDLENGLSCGVEIRDSRFTTQS